MPFGISNVTAPTLQNITDLQNASTVPELFINVNHIVYGGWLYFILLVILWVILFRAAQQKVDQPMNNAMYAGAGVTIVSFFLRAVEINREGIVRGLISDFQLWIFPLITIALATMIWMTKDK